MEALADVSPQTFEVLQTSKVWNWSNETTMSPKRQTFSDRMNLTSSAELLQLEDVSIPLRNRLWNLLRKELFACGRTIRTRNDCMDLITDEFLGVALDDLPISCELWVKWFQGRFFNLQWFDVYNLLEFLMQHSRIRYFVIPEQFAFQVNAVLEDELSGYRLVGDSVVPISSPLELESLQQALASAKQLRQIGVQTHLDTALRLFSQRPQPDYRNSIKESISAVESLVRNTAGDKDFKNALGKMEKALNLHPAFVGSLKKLFGWTSDEDGLRHSIYDLPSVGFDEAKYMLVVCSALVNYLQQKLAEQQNG